MNIKNNLSLIIHTKNEEKNIRKCILSAKNIVDEIIVIDMQSSDKTVRIAKELGAKVYSVPDYNSPDPVRNYGINMAKGKWILVLDADERLPKSLSKTIIKIIKEDKYDVVEIPYKNIHYGKWIKHTGWWPDYQDRVFKKGYVECPKTIHTRYKIKGRILTLDDKEENAIIHYQTKTISELISKIDRYTSLEKYFDKEKEFKFENILDYMDREFYWRFFEQKGYMDGMRGFILSKFMEFYRFLVFAKYWEKHNYPELGSPTQLKMALGQKKSNSVAPNELNILEKELFNKIINSKFYKIWRIYCDKKDAFMGIFHE